MFQNQRWDLSYPASAVELSQLVVWDTSVVSEEIQVPLNIISS